MARNGLVFIGHSHLSSLVHALYPRPGEVWDIDAGCEYFIFDTVRHGANFQFSVGGPDGAMVLNPDLVALVGERVPGNYRRVIVSMFGGNAHNALTLLEHPEPFDVILPEQPDLPRVDGARLLPAGYLEAFLRRMAAVYMLNLETLRHAYPDDLIIHVESPPPIGDDGFIMDHLEGYFAGQYADPCVATTTMAG